MEINTHKLYYGEKLMPWGKGCVVKNPNGWIFLGGIGGIDTNTDVKAIPSDFHPVDVLSGAEAQTRRCFERIKSTLEEMGSSLDNIVKMEFYVVGDFPDGLVSSETWQTVTRVKDEFFREHAPQLCSDNNPPTYDLLGIKHLALPEMIIEIAVVAVF